MPIQLLVTGFAPFHSFAINPSWSAARALAQRHPDRIAARLLPVDHLAARTALHIALQELRPTACLCLGLAAGDVFRLEERARKPAEFFHLPGPAEHTGTWPWDALAAQLTRLAIPHRRSRDAGQYVCESTYFALLEFAHQHAYPAQAGFLHVPAISEQFPEVRIMQIVLELPHPENCITPQM